MLFAYACSGFAGLVYQVTWTRLLVLQVGHTTAAVTTVVAAFMAGLSAGAYLGSQRARRMSAATSLIAYGLLELGIAAYSVFLPVSLRNTAPFLRYFYGEGTSEFAFTMARTLTCLFAVGAPALLLGATFPISLRALKRNEGRVVEHAGGLYAVNTAGAAVGALAAGFWLLPAYGIQRTSEIGAAASLVAAAVALLLARNAALQGVASVSHAPPARRPRLRPQDQSRPGSAAIVVACTGFSALLYEVSWTRAAATLLGPTTYAFAGTLAVLISGLALGGALGAYIISRNVPTRAVLTATLLTTAGTIAIGNALVGEQIPERLARLFADSADDPVALMMRGAFPLFLCVFPSAIGFGVSLPLTLRFADATSRDESRVALLYAVNAAFGVAATLLFGFLLTAFGLESTLRIVPIGLITAALTVIVSMPTKPSGFRYSMAGLLVVVTIAFAAAPPSWNRALLASGAYKYAPGLAQDDVLLSVLTAGVLRFYKDGQFATVSVKEFAGKMSLAIDGKVDGSTGADMLTQELVGHVPLLLHERPDNVLVVGLGTGVTVASVATHPAKRIDVVEISPEVVEASRHFEGANRDVLKDPRVSLVVGDARSHLALANRQYDVIVSEPSNPWLAGVAALFTLEAFVTMRERLAPGGLVCQWVHTYDMSEGDFRSIIATFSSVFPHATLWTIGETDMLLVAGTSPLDGRVGNVTAAWSRPGVHDDLMRVGVQEPFAVLSLWAGGAATLSRLSEAAMLQVDDRMALEFSAPLAAFGRRTNQAFLVRRALRGADVPTEVARIQEKATADQWIRRAAMFERMRLFAAAYADYRKALTKDPLQPAALTGLALTAIPAGEGDEATSHLKRVIAMNRDSIRPLVAYSQLLAAQGLTDGAILVAASGAAASGSPDRVLALKQLAALFADLGDAHRLERVVADLTRSSPQSATTMYYTASLALLQGRLLDVVTFTDRALQVDPDDAATWNLRGAALAELGRHEEAKRSFLRGLKHDADDPAIHANIGMIFMQQGNPSESARWLSGALALDPESAIARNGLAQIRER